MRSFDAIAKDLNYYVWRLNLLQSFKNPTYIQTQDIKVTKRKLSKVVQEHKEWRNETKLSKEVHHGSRSNR